MSPTSSYLSEPGKSFSKKTSPTGTVIELFLTLHFSVKYEGGSVSATARQTYCASNLELRKAKLWNDSRNVTAGETLEKHSR